MVWEAEMMLAAILPGFVMARLEGRPFGDFGLPARGAFGRNCAGGTLWGIASLSVLMLALRLAAAFEFGTLALGELDSEVRGLLRLLFLLTGFSRSLRCAGIRSRYSQKG